MQQMDLWNKFKPGCAFTCQAAGLQPGNDCPDPVRALRVGRRRLLGMHGHALVKGQSREARWWPRCLLA